MFDNNHERIESVVPNLLYGGFENEPPPVKYTDEKKKSYATRV